MIANTALTPSFHVIFRPGLGSTLTTMNSRTRPVYPLWMTFLVNEDDGRGRVRLLNWLDGIASGKDVQMFGHLVLE